MNTNTRKPESISDVPADSDAQAPQLPLPRPEEVGGRGGLDPVRYGDWEKNGRCIDF
jgi:hypothetical protein